MAHLGRSHHALDDAVGLQPGRRTAAAQLHRLQEGRLGVHLLHYVAYRGLEPLCRRAAAPLVEAVGGQPARAGGGGAGGARGCLCADVQPPAGTGSKLALWCQHPNAKIKRLGDAAVGWICCVSSRCTAYALCARSWRAAAVRRPACSRAGRPADNVTG